MPHYLIHFNQQWVGDHPAEWYESRGPLARAVVEEMRAAGVLVFADGLVEEIETAVTFDPTTEPASVIEGPYRQGIEFVGGMTIANCADDEQARYWGARIAEACGWPQEVRRVKS